MMASNSHNTSFMRLRWFLYNPAHHRRHPAAHICRAALLGPARHRRRPAARVVAAAAAAGAASPAPQSHSAASRVNRLLGWLPDKQSVQLVADAWGLLYRNLWAVVAVFLAKDAAAFVLHRLVHRLTNHSEYCSSSGSMGSQSVRPARLMTTQQSATQAGLLACSLLLASSLT